MLVRQLLNVMTVTMSCCICGLGIMLQARDDSLHGTHGQVMLGVHCHSMDGHMDIAILSISLTQQDISLLNVWKETILLNVFAIGKLKGEMVVGRQQYPKHQ